MSHHHDNHGCCNPPRTITNVYDYSIPGSQYVQESLLLVGGNACVLSGIPIADATVVIFMNGVLQLQGIDYIISGSSVTFTSIPNPAAQIVGFYVKAV